MAETPQGSGVETPKDTHGLNLQIPKKYTETPDSNKLDTPRQDVATLKEMQINDLTLKLRQDRQSLSLELEIPLG